VLIAAVLVTGALALAVEVDGDARCPRPDEVAARLQPLLADAPPGRPTRIALVREEATAITVRLTEGDGLVIAEKRLPGGRPCAELAETAAVVVAAWDARLWSGVALAFDGPLSEASPQTLAFQGAAAGARPLVADLFAGFYLGVDAQSTAPALKAGARLARPGRPWAGQVSLAAQGRESQPLGKGQTRWGRLAVGAGPSLRLGNDAWVVRLGLEALAGLLMADGVRYDETRTRFGVDAGADLGASIGRRFGRLTPWLGMELLGWLRPHQLEVTGAATTSIPRLQAWFGAGVAFGSPR
jgi:hypothetical protein